MSDVGGCVCVFRVCPEEPVEKIKQAPGSMYLFQKQVFVSRHDYLLMDTVSQ